MEECLLGERERCLRFLFEGMGDGSELWDEFLILCWLALLGNTVRLTFSRKQNEEKEIYMV